MRPGDDAGTLIALDEQAISDRVLAKISSASQPAWPRLSTTAQRIVLPPLQADGADVGRKWGGKAAWSRRASCVPVWGSPVFQMWGGRGDIIPINAKRTHGGLP